MRKGTLELKCAVIMMVLAWSGMPARADVTSGLIARYAFDGNANDSSGGAWHGDVTGTSLTTDRFGRANSAYYFDGNNARIEIPNGVLDGRNDFTFFAWVNLSTLGSNSRALLSGANPTDDNQVLLQYRTPTPWPYWGLDANVARVATASPMSLNEWHSVAAVRTGTGGQIYLDGQLISTLDRAGPGGPLAISPHGLWIGVDQDVVGGGFDATQSWIGKVDDVSFYNRALSASEVAELHSGAGSGLHTLVAWGNNSYGQTNVPAGLSGVAAIAAGGYHSMALKGDGTVVAWGRNNYGQTNVPTGLSGVVAIATGGYHSMATKFAAQPVSIELVVDKVTDTNGVAKTVFSRGQTVRVTMKARNTGATSVGANWVLNLATSSDHGTLRYNSDPTLNNVNDLTIPNDGQWHTFSFDWLIAANAPTGNYDLLAAVRDANNVLTVLDDTQDGANTTTLGPSAWVGNVLTVTEPMPAGKWTIVIHGLSPVDYDTLLGPNEFYGRMTNKLATLSGNLLFLRH